MRDKTALVTGTGSGLGRAIAIGFAKDGADVAITELPDKIAAAEETAGEIKSAGRRALVCPLDVSQLSQIDACVDLVMKEFGRIDILVNNAGINIPQPALEVTEAQWDKLLDIDLKGVFFMSQAVAKKAFVPQGRGKIVNIASQSGAAGGNTRRAHKRQTR